MLPKIHTTQVNSLGQMFLKPFVKSGLLILACPDIFL